MLVRTDVLFSVSHKRTVGGDRRLQSPRAVPPVSRRGTFLHLPVTAADRGPAPRANGVSEGRLAGLGCRAALRLGSLNDLVPRSRLGATWTGSATCTCTQVLSWERLPRAARPPPPSRPVGLNVPTRASSPGTHRPQPRTPPEAPQGEHAWPGEPRRRLTQMSVPTGPTAHTAYRVNAADTTLRP